MTIPLIVRMRTTYRLDAEKQEKMRLKRIYQTSILWRINVRHPNHLTSFSVGIVSEYHDTNFLGHLG